MALTDKINDGFIALANLVKSNSVATINNKALLPQKNWGSTKMVSKWLETRR